MEVFSHFGKKAEIFEKLDVLKWIIKQAEKMVKEQDNKEQLTEEISVQQEKRTA